MANDRITKRLAHLEAKASATNSLDVGQQIAASRTAPCRPRRTVATLQAMARDSGPVGRMARGDLRIDRIGDSTAPIDADVELAQQMAEFFADPLGFALWAFDWGTDPAMRVVRLPEPWAAKYDCEFGPDAWACDLLDDIGRQVRDRGFDGTQAVDPIRVAVASGHGIGKSAVTAWLCLWLMSTRPGSRGVVTASTAQQLSSKTWAQVGAWAKRCATRDWWDITSGAGAMKMVNKERPESWRCDAQTARAENSESFAGLHAADASPFFLVDESSGVPDSIHEVMLGAMTDGEPFLLAFGNPTRNTGWFHSAFHGQRHRWTTRCIDSRSVAITNKLQLQQWVDDFGIDSDFCKVRIRGVFPSASSLQFISRQLVDDAVARELPGTRGEATIVAVDVARFGGDQTVIFTRQGRDARTWPPIRLQGADTMAVASRVAQQVNMLRAAGQRVVTAIDGGGVGGGVIDRLRQLGFDIVEVQFGARALDPKKYAQRRTELWGLMRDWLAVGAIAKDEELIQDLVGPEYGFNSVEALQLERKQDMKARGLASPDIGDALAISFAVTPQIAMPGDSDFGDASAERARLAVLAYDPRAAMFRGHDPMGSLQ